MCGLTMWDVAEKRITNVQLRRTVANSPTMDSLMEMRRCRWLSKLCAMKESRSPMRMLGVWCTTSRLAGGRPQQTIRHAYISTFKKLGFEGEKGQLREWMIVARDRSAWGSTCLQAHSLYYYCTTVPALVEVRQMLYSDACSLSGQDFSRLIGS
jgi:hypothetical protein